MHVWHRHSRSQLRSGTAIGLWLSIVACLSLLSPEKPAPADEAKKAVPAKSAQPTVDFGRAVQPILAKRCFPCHGPDKSKSGLRLNERKSALAEAESGERSIVPGDTEKSELLRRIASTDEGERMPPEGAPLTAAQIATIRRWIEQGATWEEHWAFQPLAAQSPPAVQDQKWVRNPIDAFVLSRLERSGLAPAPPAERLALLRRAYYDLTGLPPTPADVDAFLKDESPGAYDKLLDWLLDSPAYGEHWARHWLDVVRFADTNSFERDGLKPHAWRYRDYVIRALNADKPYDQFVREQLAGDELPEPTNDSLIATGYYRLGLWDDEPADRLLAKFDTLDDIVATTGQVFLGLTVNCARCHDHKIDPIPQHDYYSLVSFFHGITPMAYNGSNIERPIFENAAAREVYDAKLRTLEEKRNGLQQKITVLEGAFRTAFEKSQAEPEGSVGSSDLDDLEFRFYRDTWDKLPDFDNLKSETTGMLPGRLFDLGPATRTTHFGFVFTGSLIVPQDGNYTFILDADDGARLQIDGKPVVEHNGVLEPLQPRRGTLTLRQGRHPIRLDYYQTQDRSRLNVLWSGPGVDQRPLSVTGKQLFNFGELLKTRGAKLLGEEKFKEFQRVQAALEAAKRETVPAEYALCVTENGPRTPDTFVLARGNPHVSGDKVEPAFPTLFAAAKPAIPDPPPNARSAGRRLVLANWIVSPDNRLTARVMVNRVWQHHFGRGIVRSPNNFGQLGDRPTHPELLDWLAAEFVKGGWKLKPLHKLIMTSSTYRMSSQSNAAGKQKDPANDLFWRFDMRRLTAEELRDSVHAVNGTLNPKMYGPGIYPEISGEVLAGQSNPGQGWGKSSPEEQARRSIYIFVKRSLITPILADFDFADTDSSCAARFATTQPTQALGMLNGHFMHAQADKLARRLEREAGPEPAAQVKLALRLALCREPDTQSVTRGLELLKSIHDKHGVNRTTALTYYCLTVLNLNEFVYLD